MELTPTVLILFCATLTLVAILYGSVGQAGASGFVAVMALFSFAPEVIKPTALVLNVLVSSVVALRFGRAGHFSWSILWPFLIASIPAAWLGGYLTLPAQVFNPVLGVLLLVAGVPFFFRKASHATQVVPLPHLPAVLAGGCIGLLSGLTGMGGGVLLAPLLLYCKWASVRTVAAVSAVFIFINSAMALLGHFTVAMQLPPDLAWFALAAIFGGAIGSQLGSLHLPPATIYRILGTILVIAGVKLVWV